MLERILMFRSKLNFVSVVCHFRPSKGLAQSFGRLRWLSGLTCFFYQEISFLALIRQDHGLLIHPDIFYSKLLVCFLKSKLKKGEKGTHFAHTLNKALNNYFSVCPKSVFTSLTPWYTSFKCETISIFACKLAQQHLNTD